MFCNALSVTVVNTSFKCDHCESKCKCKCGEWWHRKYTFNCDHCENGFNLKGNLMKHMKNKQNLIQKPEEMFGEAENLYFKCDYCENRFKIKCNAMKHIRNKHKYFQKPEEFARGSKM